MTEQNDNQMVIVESPRLLLKRFYSLQGERVETYKYFEEGFQAYLNGAPNYNFPLYRQLVHEITQTFSKISHDIININTQLEKDHGLEALSRMITAVQEDEKKKLELTAKLQLARQNIVDHPDNSSYQEESTELKQSIQDIIASVNEHLEELKFESEDIYTRNNQDEEVQVER